MAVIKLSAARAGEDTVRNIVKLLVIGLDLRTSDHLIWANKRGVLSAHENNKLRSHDFTFYRFPHLQADGVWLFCSSEFLFF